MTPGGTNQTREGHKTKAMKTIKFNRTGDMQTRFTGRNGYFKMNGIEVARGSINQVMLTAIDSRGNPARCDMEIPMENVPEFIKALEDAAGIKH